MAEKFIVDTQLPPRLSQFLVSLDYDCVHTTDFPDGHLMNDSEIRDLAVEQNRIIITKDHDFREYYIFNGAPPVVILLTMGNCSNSELLQIIKSCLPVCLSNLKHGNLFIIDSENMVAIM